MFTFQDDDLIQNTQLTNSLQMSAFWPACPSVAPGAKASTILTNLQRGNVPTQNITAVRNVDVFQRAGQGDLDKNDLTYWLRETGDEIDRPDMQGLTMMMWAAAYGQVPTVQLLLSHGSNVNVKGKENGELRLVCLGLNSCSRDGSAPGSQQFLPRAGHPPAQGGGRG